MLITVSQAREVEGAVFVQISVCAKISLCLSHFVAPVNQSVVTVTRIRFRPKAEDLEVALIFSLPLWPVKLLASFFLQYCIFSFAVACISPLLRITARLSQCPYFPENTREVCIRTQHAYTGHINERRRKVCLLRRYAAAPFAFVLSVVS
jgi:hypothetical protein